MQEVIDNLMISAIQYRSETDPDIQPHVHQRCVDERVVQPTREVDYCKQTLIHVLQDVLTSLARMQVPVPALEDSSKLD
jgi:Fanconi anemia group M protein